MRFLQKTGEAIFKLARSYRRKINSRRERSLSAASAKKLRLGENGYFRRQRFSFSFAHLRRLSVKISGGKRPAVSVSKKRESDGSNTWECLSERNGKRRGKTMGAFESIDNKRRVPVMKTCLPRRRAILPFHITPAEVRRRYGEPFFSETRAKRGDARSIAYGGDGDAPAFLIRFGVALLRLVSVFLKNRNHSELLNGRRKPRAREGDLQRFNGCR